MFWMSGSLLSEALDCCREPSDCLIVVPLRHRHRKATDIGTEEQVRQRLAVVVQMSLPVAAKLRHLVQKRLDSSKHSRVAHRGRVGARLRQRSGMSPEGIVRLMFPRLPLTLEAERVLTTLLVLACALLLAACGSRSETVPNGPIQLAEMRADPRPYYWVGESFDGLALTYATSYSRRFGNLQYRDVRVAGRLVLGRRLRSTAPGAKRALHGREGGRRLIQPRRRPRGPCRQGAPAAQRCSAARW